MTSAGWGVAAVVPCGVVVLVVVDGGLEEEEAEEMLRSRSFRAGTYRSG